jgi:hypothetical protein
MSKSLKGLMASAMILALGAGLPAPSLRNAHRPGYRPTRPKLQTDMQREIAEWNAAVDAKKKAKKDHP